MEKDGPDHSVFSPLLSPFQMCGPRSKFCSYYAVREPNETQSLHYALFSQHLLATVPGLNFKAFSFAVKVPFICSFSQPNKSSLLQSRSEVTVRSPVGECVRTSGTASWTVSRLFSTLHTDWSLQNTRWHRRGRNAPRQASVFMFCKCLSRN